MNTAEAVATLAKLDEDAGLRQLTPQELTTWDNTKEGWSATIDLNGDIAAQHAEMVANLKADLGADHVAIRRTPFNAGKVTYSAQ